MPYEPWPGVLTFTSVHKWNETAPGVSSEGCLISSGDISSGDRIRTCDLWVMSYMLRLLLAPPDLKSAAQSCYSVY